MDGRGNIRVGSGRFQRTNGGRTAEIECHFPGSQPIISPIKWVRHSQDPQYDDITDQSRFEIRNLGSSSSGLVLRNYRGYRDDGLYRCFAQRYSRTGKVQTVYMETEVRETSGYRSGYPSGYSSGYPSGYASGCRTGCRLWLAGIQENTRVVVS